MNDKFLALALLASCVSFSALPTYASTTDEQAAIGAASNWLILVDKEQYGQSWTQAAQYFKDAVKKGQWESQVKVVRDPLGKVLSRKLKSSQYAKTLPGAPDGEYVVIQYETAFEKKNKALETITPMKESSGEWKVSGYYIK